MAALMSPITGRFVAQAPDGLLVVRDEIAPETIRLFRRRRKQLDPIGSVQMHADPSEWRALLGAGRRGERVMLSLTGCLLLYQTVLPLTADGDLGSVLRHEMDRLTPFTIGDVFFTYAVLCRDRAKNQLTVELALAPRTWVADLLDQLTQAGVCPSMIEAEGPDGIPRRIPLTHAEPSRTVRTVAAKRLGWAVCAALAVAVLAVPLQRQSADLSNLRQRIAELRPGVDQVDALRNRIVASNNDAGRLIEARRRSTEALRVIALLTTLMPDDTRLTSLGFRQHWVTAEGQSASATKLISTLAIDPGLKNPAFVTPVVRSDSGSDRFTIQAGFGS